MTNDTKLLGYVAAALFLFMAMLLLLTLQHAGRVRGARQWLWSTLIMAVAVGLNASQDMLPAFFGLVLSNTLATIGPLISARGSFEYRYHRLLPARWFYIATAIAALLFGYFVHVAPSANYRIFFVALVISAAGLWHAWILLAGSALRPRSSGVANARFRLAHAIMVSGLLTIAMLFCLIALGVYRTETDVRGPVALRHAWQSPLAFYLAGMVGRVLLLIGMVLVLIDELDHALRTVASRDALTDIFNRRGFREAAASQPLTGCSLLMLDLDQFKAVNDDFGHHQGDRVIALLAHCAKANLPANAIIARLGGEEFCALLPQADSDLAGTHAESLRAAFQRDSSAFGHTRQHTVSIGVASAQSPDATLSQLMSHADQALYRAKRDGRNRVQKADIE